MLKTIRIYCKWQLPIFILLFISNSCGDGKNNFIQYYNIGEQKVNLSRKYLTEIPPWIFKQEDLVGLNLHNNRLSYLPPEIGNLVNLERLIISRNDLTSIPPEIGKLKKLRKLSLKANKLVSLPKEIGELENLEELHLSFNQLTSLPAEICDLPKLSHLYLEFNQLESLPERIGEMPAIFHLVIGQNQLKRLPPSFYGLTQLNFLDVSMAGPNFVLSDSICAFRLMEELCIDNYGLSFAPNCLAIRARSNNRFRILIKN